MLVLMKCVAEAVVARKLNFLVQLVPGGQYLYEVGADAYKRLKDKQRDKEIREELRKSVEASFPEVRAAAERVAAEVARKAAADERAALELFLAQVPAAVRRSLRRTDDPTGRTVPPGLALASPNDLIKLLPAQMPRFRPGQALPGNDNWSLIEPLGMGGFGEVWRAQHEIVEDRAVKFCTDPDARQRLLTHEGKLVARVMKEGRHPNVVALLDADTRNATPWLMYEYVGGGDLAGLILSWQRLDIDERVRQAKDALRVLARTAGHFHDLSPPIVHRDLKPANILVEPDDTLKITDFGIGGIAAGKLISASRHGATAYTRAASLLAGAFTPIYASPEQQRGDGPDPRDDVHALGVIAYQMLVGRLDSGPGPRFERAMQALGVPDDLIELLGDCVEHDLDRRPANGNELASRLGGSSRKSAPRPVRKVPKPPAPEPDNDLPAYPTQEYDERPEPPRPPAPRETTPWDAPATPTGYVADEFEIPPLPDDSDEVPVDAPADDGPISSISLTAPEPPKPPSTEEWGSEAYRDAAAAKVPEPPRPPRVRPKPRAVAEPAAEPAAKKKPVRPSSKPEPAPVQPPGWPRGVKAVGRALFAGLLPLAFLPAAEVATAVAPPYLGAALGGMTLVALTFSAMLIVLSIIAGPLNTVKRPAILLVVAVLLVGEIAAMGTLHFPPVEAVAVAAGVSLLVWGGFISTESTPDSIFGVIIASVGLAAVVVGWMGFRPLDAALAASAVGGSGTLLVFGLGGKRVL